MVVPVGRLGAPFLVLRNDDAGVPQSEAETLIEVESLAEGAERVVVVLVEVPGRGRRYAAVSDAG
ncbi:MAG: hypothetical protein H6Q85_2984, partial [candidate division NC10 bacterium]|nr:hypothetical protein [candidate division NC10 bacterium]